MPRPYIPKSLKSKVVERANGYCEYCYSHSGHSPSSFVIDHIYPFSLGGLSESKNLALSCGDCNNHKYQKTHYFDPVTNQKVNLFHPRKNYWPNHFQWNEDETIIIGISPSGRASLNLLNMNREGNINLRHLMILVGLHPPKEYIKD